MTSPIEFAADSAQQFTLGVLCGYLLARVEVIVWSKLKGFWRAW